MSMLIDMFINRNKRKNGKSLGRRMPVMKTFKSKAARRRK